MPLPVRLTLIHVQSKTSMKRKVLFLLNAGHSPIATGQSQVSQLFLLCCSFSLWGAYKSISRTSLFHLVQSICCQTSEQASYSSQQIQSLVCKDHSCILLSSTKQNHVSVAQTCLLRCGSLSFKEFLIDLKLTNHFSPFSPFCPLNTMTPLYL